MKKSFKNLIVMFILLMSLTLITGCTNNITEKLSNKAYGLNDTFTFDDLEITIGDNIEFTRVNNQFSDYDGKTVVKLPITVKNIKDETHRLNMFYYSIFGTEGIELDSLSAYFDDAVDYAGDLKNGGSYTKYLYFLYDGDGEYSIEFDNYSSKVIVEFDVKK